MDAKSKLLVWVALLTCSNVAAAESVRAFGVMADAGVPDGAMASLVYRPVSQIRLHGGVGHNGVSKGARVGVTLTPFRTWFSPTLSADYGRYAEGDANPLVRMVTGDEGFSSGLLERVGYDFANAHLGFAFGRKRFSFYLQAGMSRTSGTLHPEQMSSVTFTEDPHVTIWSVSARLGFVLYIH
jgi:hypothetical protein